MEDVCVASAIHSQCAKLFAKLLIGVRGANVRKVGGLVSSDANDLEKPECSLCVRAGVRCEVHAVFVCF